MFKTESLPRIIADVSDIPEVFQEEYTRNKGGKFKFPDTIYIPKASWGDRYVNEKMVCDFEEELLIMEHDEEKTITSSIRHKDINYVQNGRVLLYSWIFISSVYGKELQSHMIVFNSSDEKKFVPLINSLRKRINGICEVEFNNDSMLDFLYPDNLKFLNYSYKSVIQGEKVLFAIFQDSIYEAHVKAMDERVAPNHLVILCDKELIFISETLTEEKEMDTYSGVASYLNLGQIEDIQLTKNSAGRYVLSIAMKNNDVISSVYESEKRAELDQLVKRIRRLVE